MGRAAKRKQLKTMNTKKTPRELFIDSLKGILSTDFTSDKITIFHKTETKDTIKIRELYNDKEPVESTATSISEIFTKLCSIAIAHDKKGATVAMVEEGIMQVEFVDSAAIAFAQNEFAKTLTRIMLKLDTKHERILVLANTSFVWIADFHNLSDAITSE